MSTETLEQYYKVTRGTLDALKELSGMNIKLVEKLTEQQFELAGASIDASVKAANLALTTPDFKELASQQSQLVSDYNERVLGIARKSSGIVAEVKDEYSGWMEGRLKETGAPITRVPTPSPAAAKRSA